MQLNATTLAQRLGVSKARVSQYVSQGLLAGCYVGEGRARRFDLERVQQALTRGLDPGQLLGNGAQTKAALQKLDVEADPEAGPADRQARGPKSVRSDTELEPRDPDRYELARIQNAEEDARRKRRDNARDEGRWVLAEEIERRATRMLAREMGQFEAVLRDGARAVADKLGVDYRETRQILVAEWRGHRARQAEALGAEAEDIALTAEEQDADI